MTGRTGYTAPTNASPFAGPAQMEDIYEHFDPIVGENVATSSALPATGNWVGRTVYVNEGVVAVCTALPNTWKASWVVPPYVILRKQTTPKQYTSGTGNTWTDVTWEIEDADVGAMHSTSTNPERILCTRTGLVQINIKVKIGTTSAVLRTRVAKNGTAVDATTIDDKVGTSTAEPVAMSVFDVPVSAGDYLTVQVSSSTATVEIRTDETRVSARYVTAS